MFAGNIGEAQDFEHTLKAFSLLRQQGIEDINLVIVGDGRKKKWVEDYIAEHQLSKIVHCVGRHPLNTMGLFFKQADVLYLALKDSLIFNLTCPAKLQAYMSAGKPVLAMINGEGAQIINEAQCGMSVNASDYRALSETLIKISTLSKEELSRMGTCGKNFCRNSFSFDKNMHNLENWIIS